MPKYGVFNLFCKDFFASGIDADSFSPEGFNQSVGKIPGMIAWSRVADTVDEAKYL